MWRLLNTPSHSLAPLPFGSPHFAFFAWMSEVAVDYWLIGCSQPWPPISNWWNTKFSTNFKFQSILHLNNESKLEVHKIFFNFAIRCHWNVDSVRVFVCVCVFNVHWSARESVSNLPTLLSLQFQSSASASRSIQFIQALQRSVRIAWAKGAKFKTKSMHKKLFIVLYKLKLVLPNI